MRDEILSAAENYFLGKIGYHRLNLEVYLQNSAGIGDHSDIMSAVEEEVSKIAEYQEKLEVVRNLNE